MKRTAPAPSSRQRPDGPLCRPAHNPAAPPEPRHALSRLALAIPALAAGLVAAVPSSAQVYSPRDVEGWTVAASSDGKGCFLTRQYRGPGTTTLLFGLDTDGSNRLSVLNANWSIREKDRLKLTFRFTGAAFPAHLAVGIVADGRQGFVTDFGAPFPATFAASKFLRIARGAVPVEDLALEGSGAAVAELRKCVALFRDGQEPPASARDRAGSIPLDPFAPDSPRKGKR